MSYKAKSLLYFASFVIAAITYYNVSNTQHSVSDVNELAKADVEQTTIERLNQNIQ